MDELDFIRAKYYFYVKLTLEDGVGLITIDAFDVTSRRLEEAYQKKDLKYLRAMNRELNAVFNSYPEPDKTRLLKRLKEEVGEDFTETELKMKQKVARIMKRGVVKNRSEYDLIMSMLDSIYSNSRPEVEFTPEENELIDKYQTLLETADFKE